MLDEIDQFPLINSCDWPTYLLKYSTLNNFINISSFYSSQWADSNDIFGNLLYKILMKLFDVEYAII